MMAYVNAETIIATLIGLAVAALWNLVKEALLNPGKVAEMEKKNIVRDTQIAALFRKVRRIEDRVLIYEHEAGRDVSDIIGSRRDDLDGQ